jgi:hypothetical protein
VFGDAIVTIGAFAGAITVFGDAIVTVGDAIGDISVFAIWLVR